MVDDAKDLFDIELDEFQKKAKVITLPLRRARSLPRCPCSAAPSAVQRPVR